MKPALKRTLMIGLLALLLAGLIAGCNRGRRDETPEPVSAEGDLPANASRSQPNAA